MADNRKKLPKAMLEDVYFYFTNIKNARKKYKSETEYQYGITVALSKAQKNAFKAIRVDGIKLNKTVKEVPNEEFETTFKTKVPYPEQDEQYTVQITQNAIFKSGKSLPDFLRPRAFTTIDGDLDNLTDITNTEIGNGSFGNLRYLQEEGESGISIKLDQILVTKLVPYEGRKDTWAANVKDGSDAYITSGVPALASSSGAVQPSASVRQQEPKQFNDDDLPF